MNSVPHHPLRFGILGCAKVARQFARDVTPSPKVSIVAVASRDAGKAAEFGDSFGIDRRHANYEALLADPEVDAVYVALPNSMHAEWSICAAKHGKNILCEKPLAMGGVEAKAMFDAARLHDVLLVEAYPYWFQPQTADMMALLRSPHGSCIGDVRSIQVSLGFTMVNPQTNIRGNSALGGGALLDAGSYNLSLICMVMGCAPVSVRAEATWTETGVDICTIAWLRYADGQHAQVSCAMDMAAHRRAVIVGENGVIETEFLNHTSDDPQHPWHYFPSEMRLRKSSTATVPFEQIHSRTGSGFRFGAEAFARMVVEKDIAGMDRLAAISLDVARTIDAIAESARSGEEVAVKV
jgi:predicted dehydrogenase